MIQETNFALQWHTEQRMVKELIPFESNPRLITNKQRTDLQASIEKFDLVEIPAINLDNKLIAGHQRCKILMAQGRGEELIDVRVPNRLLTEQEFKEYNIRSNANTGSWDLNLLEDRFSNDELKDWGLDYDVAVKMNKVMKVDIIDDIVEEEDPVPVISDKPPLVKYGDQFRLGKHHVMCGDAKNDNDCLQLMQLQHARMIFTDPPYNVQIDSIVNLGSTQHKEFKEGSGELSREEFLNLLHRSFTNLHKYSVEGSIHFICMDWKHISEIMEAASQVYNELKNLCVWVKDNGGMGTFYRSQHELVFVYKKGTIHHVNNFELGQYGRYRTNVWEYAGANSFSNRSMKEDSKLHPTVKPATMVADAIQDCSYLDDIIADFFLGSGTTVIACEQTRRRCYGIELDERFIEVIIRRYYNYLKRLNRAVEFEHCNGKLSLEQIVNNI